MLEMQGREAGFEDGGRLASTATQWPPLPGRPHAGVIGDEELQRSSGPESRPSAKSEAPLPAASATCGRRRRF
jgi:hypothetical protein